MFLHHGGHISGNPSCPPPRALPACYSSKGRLRVLSDLFWGWVGIGVRGHREWNPLSSVNLKLFIVAPGRKNSRNAARYATGSSGVVRWQAAPHPVESYLWVKGSVSWGETARSSKAELFLTAKTKLPVFMEIYTLPEKNGGKEKLCREHGFSRNSGEWCAHWGALSQPPEGGRIGSLINTSLPLEMSHTEFEKLSVCPG